MEFAQHNKTKRLKVFCLYFWVSFPKTRSFTIKMIQYTILHILTFNTQSNLSVQCKTNCGMLRNRIFLICLASGNNNITPPKKFKGALLQHRTSITLSVSVRKKREQNQCSRTRYCLLLFHTFFFLSKPDNFDPQCNSSTDVSGRFRFVMLLLMQT